MEPFEGKKTSEVKTMVLNGTRLEFPATTPTEIKELVTQHIFNKAEDRYTMTEDRYTMSDIVKKLEQLSGIKQPPPKRNKGSLKTATGRTITADDTNVSMEASTKGSCSTKKMKRRKRNTRSRPNIIHPPQRFSSSN
uniref:Uncharacterized protein n=1 Tax=Panagrolaimus sp. PS1159 TaxID=55785 RepID=A0AC35FS91_9BILA